MLNFAVHTNTVLFNSVYVFIKQLFVQYIFKLLIHLLYNLIRKERKRKKNRGLITKDKDTYLYYYRKK